MSGESLPNLLLKSHGVDFSATQGGFARAPGAGDTDLCSTVHGLIYLSAWKSNSAKSTYSILYRTASINSPAPSQEVFQTPTPYHLSRWRINIRIAAYGRPRGRRSRKARLVAISRAVAGHRGRWKNEYRSGESRHALDQTSRATYSSADPAPDIHSCSKPP